MWGLVCLGLGMLGLGLSTLPDTVICLTLAEFDGK